jgi:subtilase family serine protease
MTRRPFVLRGAGAAGLAAAALVASALVATGSASADAAGTGPAARVAPTVRANCAVAAPGTLRCFALHQVNPAEPSALRADAVNPALTPSGFGPSDLVSAYNLPAGGGAGQTVAIVDAYNDPDAESDLATYRTQFGLAACTTANGCFKKVNQTGGTTYPPTDAGWSGEIALDVEMVSAAAPAAHILLVEASSANLDDLGTAVNEAVALGAKYVSNSYGGPEDSTDLSSDTFYYNHPGVVVTVSSGDAGYGAEYPASSRYVTAVGGTNLSRSATTRGWSESVWGSGNNAQGGAGSGCSAYDAKPTWQKDTGCTKRTVADVSAVADPNTGVAVYDTFSGGWNVYGGTSVSSPLIAAVYADAGTPAAGSYPSSYPYAAPAGALNDVTSGQNGFCSSTPYLCEGLVGYDGPTGLGTPNGVAAFKAPAVASGNADLGVTITGPASIAVGKAGKYVTTIANHGPNAATSITMTVTVGSGLTIVSANNGGVISGSTVTWTLASIGKTGKHAFKLTVRATAAGTSQLSGAVSAATPDPVGTNNTFLLTVSL